ncbi:MAG TPA: DnaJ domain-containing protein [Candidatus Angelobacter sp.]|nr:DnaJ domain-containing protein [Candidatus Angelobacter sp.]
MTEAKRDYYQVLGVPRTATEQEINAAFQKLVREFHSAGKPKNIDDVEWLRTVTREYRVLSDTALRMHYDRTGDDTPLFSTPAHGYDQAFLEQLERRVDNQAVLHGSMWLTHELFNFL